MGKRCSVGLTRQTPRRWGFRPVGVLSWGLDAGTPITTVRLTPLPVLGVLMVLLGYGSPWIGFGYAVGFLGSLTLATMWPQPNEREFPLPFDVTRPLSRSVSRVRLGGTLCTVAAMIGVFVAIATDYL